MTISAVADAPKADLERYFVLGTVTLATMMFAMAVTNAYVVLPQMQGSLSATQDQIAWSVTLNLVAMAVMTPTSGWLANRFGRRAVMLWCVAGFSLSTLLCGTATTLEALVAYRIAQGALGAPITPLSQAIILNAFPRHQHALATAVWGMGVVIGPIIGPTLGGFIAEAYNWRWVFYMVLPICVVSIVGIWVFITERQKNQESRLDWTGFLALAIAIGSLQLMLDRGERLDWFNSLEIIIEAGLAVTGLYIFVVHSLTSNNPFLRPQLLLDRNFGLGLVFALVFGALAFVPMVLLPTLLQELRGFPDSIVGIVLAARSVGSMIGTVSVVWMSRFDPRISLAIGFLTQGLSGLFMAQFDLNVSTWDAMWTGALQGFGNSYLWVPLTVLAFATLPSRHMGEGTAVFHLIRNLGSALFISVCVGTVVHFAGVNYSVLSENISEFNEAFRLSSVAGGWNIDTLDGIARAGREVQRQASMIGYINAFYLFAAVSFAIVPFIFLLKRPDGK
ncbi:MAG: DHA2 family efflux MFS transporter permease subunit [Pseudomonadota bacterium]|jgi:DHA2 family multidrug resistance protein|nr:DHA2 family efflux MFS transporter permease subunit [Pseudomonadota bacterium]